MVTKKQEKARKKLRQKQSLRFLKYSCAIIDKGIEKHYNKETDTISKEKSRIIEEMIFESIDITKELSFPYTIKGLYYKSRLQAMFIELNMIEKI